ncbi:MFS transporter [Methylobacterium nigriterrae]|uniref:MFS transporter n=1 Tax=Methylobacterium nigriterrae TaxID=3127512 RepID=UPI00301379AB
MTSAAEARRSAASREGAYRSLLAAHVLALVSTGVATVALALLAYRLVGAEAGAVLGTALAIKMLTYALIAPVAAAFVDHLPRRALFAGLNLFRAGILLILPFVGQAWEIYLLVFIFQFASAIFTPSYQATIPDLLPDERDYLRALSLSRFLSELEGLASPALSAVLLLLVNARGLFVGAAIGFVLATLLILPISMPQPLRNPTGGILERTGRGLGRFLTVPRLRGLIGINVAVALAAATAAVNTVVLVQNRLGLGERETAIALACFGAGSVTGALLVPHLLRKASDRPVMLVGAALVASMLIVAPLMLGYARLLAIWFVLGAGCSVAHTPAGRLLCRSGTAAEMPALYAAQFSVFHLCLAVAYAVAGRMGSAIGILWDFIGLGLVAALAVAASARFWPRASR